MRFIRSFPLGVLVLAGLAACTSQDSAALQLTLGNEPTTFTQAPAVTEILIQQVDSTGTTTTLGYAPVTATTIPLASQSENETVSFEATGLDSADAAVVFGATIPLQLGAVVGDTIPIFVGRIGQFARAPLPPVDSEGGLDPRQAPLLTMVQGQYLFIAGGTVQDGGALPEGDAGPLYTPLATTQLYDFGGFTMLPAPPTLPSLDGGALFAPLSAAATGTVMWLVGPQGGMYFDLSSNEYLQIPEPPAGAFSGSFVDIAGGSTVTDDQGAQYIVGATRTTGAPTSVVLEINPNDTSNANYPNGNVSWLALSEPRLGASATWVTGRGLVVAGGSASGSGVEILNAMDGTSATSSLTGLSTSGSPVPYAADPSVGAGATALADGQHVLLAGGVLPDGQDAGVRVIDLACTTGCTPTWWTSLPVALGTAQAFALSATSALVIGNEPASGLTHAFFLTGPASSTTVIADAASDASDASVADATSVVDAASEASAADAASVTSDAAVSDAAMVSDAASVSDAAVSDAAVSDAAVSDAAVVTSVSILDDGAADDAEAPAVAGPGTAVEVLLPTNQGNDSGAPIISLHNARAIVSPVGTIVVYGGYGSVDSFQPPL